MGLIVSTGIKKLLKYLGKVTGKDFVDTFVDAIYILFRNRKSFLEALNFQETLKNNELTNWILVTSVEQSKINEAEELHNLAQNIIHGNALLAVNKCINQHLNDWNPKESKLQQIKDSMTYREKEINLFALRRFKAVLKFPEILDETTENQVSSLAINWQ